jgi:creatinine amidohydrolase
MSRWLDLSWPEIAALPADTVAVLPLGAVEQHGPHLPVSTDYVCASEIAAAAVDLVVRDGRAPCVLLPGLCYTKSDEHHAFPGSIWLSWDTLMNTLVDIGRSLAASGISRLLFVNGHGGNSALGQVACRELRRRFGLRTFFTHPGVPVDQGGGGSAASELGMGVHGGHGETSLMLHLRPELVRMDLAVARVPQVLTEFTHIGFGKPTSFGWTSDDFGPDGHIGDPTGATAAHGKAFVETAVPLLAEVIAEAHRFRTR